MSDLSVSREIGAPAERVWAALADFGNIQAFHPGLSGSSLIGDQAQGVGALRRCDVKSGGYLEERVVDWVEGERYSVAITKTSFPIKDAHATLSVEPRGADGSRATMQVRFKPKFGPLGAMMDGLMLGPTMRKQMQGVLDGLADLAERGTRSSPEGTVSARPTG